MPSACITHIVPISEPVNHELRLPSFSPFMGFVLWITTRKRHSHSRKLWLQFLDLPYHWRTDYPAIALTATVSLVGHSAQRNSRLFISAKAHQPQPSLI